MYILDNILPIVLALAAAMLAFGLAVGLVGLAKFAHGRQTGYLHFGIYAMTLMTALQVLLSGRTLISDLSGNLIVESEAVGPLLQWIQRAVTVFLLTVAAERIINYMQAHQGRIGVSVALTLTFILYWLGSVVSPSVLGAIPFFSHEYVYPFIIGMGALCINQRECTLVVRSLRDAMLALIIASFLVIAVKPTIVLEMNYSQGFFPGLPRFAGLAPHALTMGMLCQLGMYSLLVEPFKQKWLNRIAWFLSLLTLFLIQSKTAWLSFLPCVLVIYLSIHGENMKRKWSNPDKPELSILLLGLILICVIGICVLYLVGGIDKSIDKFFNSKDSEMLTSLNGRDKIWEIAFAEWHRNPIFGYGPLMFDENYRKSIDMPFAYHGHNQLIDILARSGLVGALTLLLYAGVLMVLAFRYAIRSKGLTLALFFGLLFRAIAEIPLTLYGYGSEFIGHFVLICLIAGHAGQNVAKLSTTNQAVLSIKPTNLPISL